MNRNSNGMAIVLPSLKKKELTEFYRNFIQVLQLHLNDPIIILGSRTQIQSFSGLDFSSSSGMNIPCTGLTNPEYEEGSLLNLEKQGNLFWSDWFGEFPDIWIRDFTPVWINDKWIKFEFSPSYYFKKEKYIVDHLNYIGSRLLTKIYQHSSLLVQNATPDWEPRRSPLIIDGGNIIYNGDRDALISSRIFQDNPHYSLQQIREFFSSVGITTLHILGCEPGDLTGHLDGTVRFIDTNSVIVADYPEYNQSLTNIISYPEYRTDKAYLDGLAKELSEHYKVHRICNGIPVKGGKEGMGSANGNYINYFKYDNKIFVPQYENRELNLKALSEIENLFKEITPTLIPVDCTALAQYGGVLNCITWSY